MRKFRGKFLLISYWPAVKIFVRSVNVVNKVKNYSCTSVMIYYNYYYNITVAGYLYIYIHTYRHMCMKYDRSLKLKGGLPFNLEFIKALIQKLLVVLHKFSPLFQNEFIVILKFMNFIKK